MLIFGLLFLSGCVYSDKLQEKALQNAPGYNVKSYAERQPEDPDAEKKLSVSAPRQNNSQQNQEPQEPQGKNNLDSKQPPTMQIDTNKTYQAVLKTTEGEITIDLDVKKTPKTVNNFISLARNGFYKIRKIF